MTNTCYYKILGINKKATETEIKKAYKKLAVKWHPDKNMNNKDVAEAKFKEISEAYAVLSDPEKRKKYDMFGKDGPQGNNNFSGNVNPHDIFKDFFQSQGHQGGFTFTTSGGSPNQFHTVFNNMNGMGRPNRRSRRKQKAKTIERNVNCTLSELYKGVTKTFKISRNVINEYGQRKIEEEKLVIKIMPGFKDGTKITFKEKGDMKPGIIPSDITFTVKEKKDEFYSRDEKNPEDLIITKRVTLHEALGGFNAVIYTVDGREKIYNIPAFARSNYTYVCKGEGMPIRKKGVNEISSYGNIIIKFIIIFPDLNNKDRKKILQILAQA